MIGGDNADLHVLGRRRDGLRFGVTASTPGAEAVSSPRRLCACTQRCWAPGSPYLLARRSAAPTKPGHIARAVEERRTEWITVSGILAAAALAALTGALVAEGTDPEHELSPWFFIIPALAVPVSLYFVVSPLLRWWPFRPDVRSEHADPRTPPPSPPPLADEHQRQQLRDRLGLRPLGALEVGRHVPEVPDGTYFFVWSFGLGRGLLNLADVSDTADQTDHDVEMHRRSGGDLYFLGYVAPAVAGMLTSTVDEDETLNVFPSPWADSTELVSFPLAQISAIEQRSFKEGVVFDVKVKGSLPNDSIVD